MTQEDAGSRYWDLVEARADARRAALQEPAHGWELKSNIFVNGLAIGVYAGVALVIAAVVAGLMGVMP